MRALSAPSVSFFCRAPFSSAAWASAFSSVPYFSRSLRAVFSPTPGIPGKLSELSPIRPFRSGIRAGTRPYCSIRSASSYSTVSFAFFGISTCVLGPISCSASRSPVTSNASTPLSLANRANVPRISSASKRGHSHTAIPISASSFFIRGICVRRSSGISARPAL